MMHLTLGWSFSPSLNPRAEDEGYIYGDALQDPFWRNWLEPLIKPGLPPMGYLPLLEFYLKIKL
jgi:hypothetical protein